MLWQGQNVEFAIIFLYVAVVTYPVIPVTFAACHAFLLYRAWGDARRQVLRWIPLFALLSVLVMFLPAEARSGTGPISGLSVRVTAWDVRLDRFWMVQALINPLAIVGWWLLLRRAKTRGRDPGE